MSAVTRVHIYSSNNVCTSTWVVDHGTADHLFEPRLIGNSGDLASGTIIERLVASLCPLYRRNCSQPVLIRSCTIDPKLPARQCHG